jgi:hypothetical protein
VADLFCSAIIISSQQSLSFNASIESFTNLGKYIVQRDSHSSLSLFCDFALLKLSGILVSVPNKRLGILRLLHAFAPNESQSHVQCIKKVQSIITDLPTFVQCLAILSALETSFDEMLIDLYSYYSCIGLGLPSPKVR